MIIDVSTSWFLIIFLRRDEDLVHVYHQGLWYVNGNRGTMVKERFSLEQLLIGTKNTESVAATASRESDIIATLSLE